MTSNLTTHTESVRVNERLDASHEMCAETETLFFRISGVYFDRSVRRYEKPKAKENKNMYKRLSAHGVHTETS